MISNDHPITPPAWLIDKRDSPDYSVIDDYVFFSRWGADEQLGICLKWLRDHGHDIVARELREHCRPIKPQPPETVIVDGYTYRLEA